MRIKLLIKLFLLSILIVSCKKVTTTNDNKHDSIPIDSLYSLLNYPKWQHHDSIESEYGAAYPAIKLDRVTLNNVKNIFGEPDKEFVASASSLASKEPLDDPYFEDLVKKLSGIKIYEGVWYLDNDFTLTLYFFYDGDSLRSFYGYKRIPALYIR